MTLFFIVAVPALAQTAPADSIAHDPMDSVEVSLLTCQPHDEVYSLYGHTALRFRDLRRGKSIDAAFNYGVFDFKKPHFILRFVFGLTDYELGAYPYEAFLEEYRHFGSMVTEQVLNLTSAEKQRLRLLLSENLKPENSVYRYNYFYNNCTTKARDIIEQCIDGTVEYVGREDYTPSYREMVHQMTKDHPWMQAGNDLLLGIKADWSTDRREQEFLPNNLMYDFDHAQIYTNGRYRPLVRERRIAVPAGVQVVQSGLPLSPWGCGLILLVFCVLLFVVEWRQRRVFVALDVALMVFTGSIGIVLACMLFSQHPTVSLNLQFILCNPLPWFYLWPVVRRRSTHYWHLTAILSVMFLVGAIFQHYASGLLVLAPCLLLQCYANLRLKGHK